MAEKALRAWVGERLHALVGYSNSSTTSFVVSLAASAATPGALAAQLADADVRDAAFSEIGRAHV